MVDDIKISTFALIALSIPTTTMNSFTMEVDIINLVGNTITHTGNNTNININLVNNTRGCCRVVDDIKGETFAIIAFVTLTTSYSSPTFCSLPPSIKDRQLNHDIWVRVLCKKPQACQNL